MNDKKDDTEVVDKLGNFAKTDTTLTNTGGVSSASLGYGGIAFTAPTPYPETKEGPELPETLGANFRMFSDAYRAVKWLAEGNNPYRDNTIQEGYDPKKLADQVKPADQPKIYQTTSELEGQYMLKKILQEYEDNEIRENSGWFANTTTTLGASLISPTWAIPFSQTVKYASAGKGFVEGIKHAAVNIVPAIAVQNAILTGTKETEGLQQWVNDTLFESFLALSFGGELGANAGKGVAKNIDTAKAVFKAIDDEVGIAVQLNEKGAPTGKLTAYSLPGEGSTVSAAELRVRKVQDLLDKTNPLENNPYTKKLFAWAQPIIEGLTSPWAIVRDMTDTIHPHNMQTAGGEIAAVRDAPLVNLKRQHDALYQSLKLMQSEAWLKHIGMDSGIAKNIRGNIGANQDKWISQIEFNEKTGKAYRRGGNTGDPAIDGMVGKWKKEIFDAMWEELGKRIPGLQKHEFTNIVNHLSRMYNRAAIEANPVGFLSDLTTYHKKVRDQIEAITAPIERLELENAGLVHELDHYKEQLANATPEQKKALRQTIKDTAENLKANKKAMRELDQRIQADIDEGKISIDMLDEAPEFTKAQLDQIDLLNKPIVHLTDELKKAKKDLKILGQANQQEDVSKKSQEGMKAKRIKAREKIKDIKNKLAEAEKNLERMINEPTFDQALLYEKKGRYGEVKKVLRNTDKRPRLRRVLTDREIDVISNDTMDKITQMNDEQVSGMIFDNVTGRGGTDVLKQRTQLWNDATAEPWLISDINVIAGNYVNQMTRRIQMEDLLKKYGLEGVDTSKKIGIENIEGRKAISRLFNMEYKEKRAAILAKGGDTEKELLKLSKEREKGITFLANSLDVFMGNYNDRSTTAYRVANGLKQFASATLLGNLPILALTEFFTPLFRFTMDEYFQDGLASVLDESAKLLKSGKIDRASFQDLGIGMNVANGKHIEAISGYGTSNLPKNAVERGVQNITNLSHNLSLSNYITDIQENMVANMSQAKSIRYFEKLKNGEKLSAQEIGRLDEIRLNPTKQMTLPDGRVMSQADVILEQVAKHGTPMEGGGVVSNWHLWDDYAYEAREAFKSSIEKETRSVITKPNPLDIPFAFRDPATSLVVQFMNWSFGATMNFAIPVMTKPDAQKFMGILATMAMSSLIDPFRQLAKGEEVDLSPQALATSAFVNSGFFTWYMDLIQKGNAVLDVPLLRPFQGDRFRRKDPWSVLAGPTAGMAADIATLASALANFDITRRDADIAMRYAIPFSHNVMFRRPTDAMIDAIGLPTERAKRDFKYFED